LLKAAVTDALNELLAPIQEEFKADKAWQEITEKAYPPPVVEKKAKKVKNLGSRFPGNKNEAKGQEEKVPTLPDTSEKSDEQIVKDAAQLDIQK
jgi:tyrosyl-tRNA synthetase